MTEGLTKAEKLERNAERAAARKRLTKGGSVVLTVDHEKAAEILSRAHHNRVPAPGRSY